MARVAWERERGRVSGVWGTAGAPGQHRGNKGGEGVKGGVAAAVSGR